jgi:hypothetical protein
VVCRINVEVPPIDCDKKGDKGLLHIGKARKIPGQEKKREKPPPIPAQIQLSDGGKTHPGADDMSAQPDGSFTSTNIM